MGKGKNAFSKDEMRVAVKTMLLILFKPTRSFGPFHMMHGKLTANLMLGRKSGRRVNLPIRFLGSCT